MRKFIFTSTFLSLCLLFSCEKKQEVFASISGSWRCNEFNPILGNRVYLVDIEKSQRDTTLYLLSNFYDEEYTEFVYAQLKLGKLIIAEQPLASLIIKSGTGTVSIDFTSIDFHYTVFDGQNEIFIHAIYSRPN